MGQSINARLSFKELRQIGIVDIRIILNRGNENIYRIKFQTGKVHSYTLSKNCLVNIN